MTNYKEYTQKSDAITMEQAAEICEKIRKSLDPADEDGMEILCLLVKWILTFGNLEKKDTRNSSYGGRE